MKLITVYKPDEVIMENQEYKNYEKTKLFTIDENKTKKEIIEWFKENCNMPAYLWASWDSFLDCMRDYKDYHDERLNIIIQLQGVNENAIRLQENPLSCNISGDIQDFLQCMITVISENIPCKIIFKISCKGDIACIQDCIYQALYAYEE